VADSTFYAPVHAYLARVHAPPEPRAAIDFLHGLAAWDFREAAPASSVLLDAARAGDLWLDADVLRDGAVVARLASHDRRGGAGAAVGAAGYLRGVGYVAAPIALATALVMLTPVMSSPVRRWLRSDTIPSTPLDAVVVLSANLYADSSLNPQAAARLIGGLAVL